MRRLLRTVAVAAAIGAPGLAGTAHAVPFACDLTACASVSISGSAGACSAGANGHRHCNWTFAWQATGTSPLPGRLDWFVSVPDGNGTGGNCSWLSGGCSSGPRSSSGQSVVPCGSSVTAWGDIAGVADDNVGNAIADLSTPVTLVAAPC